MLFKKPMQFITHFNVLQIVHANKLILLTEGLCISALTARFLFDKGLVLCHSFVIAMCRDLHEF